VGSEIGNAGGGLLSNFGLIGIDGFVPARTAQFEARSKTGSISNWTVKRAVPTLPAFAVWYSVGSRFETIDL
jgi:hypothetical protein